MDRSVRHVKAAGTVPDVADPLRFVLDVAADQERRDRFRADPHRVLDAEVDGSADLTGEDVAALAEVLRARVAPPVAARVDVPEPPRPVGDETPRDAAVRLLVGLCDALDGPAVEPVTLPHREHPTDPPMPSQVARGGGEPVPTEPPGGRWLHPVVPDDEG